MAVSAASLSVDVSADVSAAQSAMADVDALIQQLAGDHAPVTITATVDDALTGIDSVTTAADDLASVAPNVLVDADTSAAIDGLTEVVDAAASVADTAVTATVDADTDAAISALSDVETAAQELDSENPTLTVDADTSGAEDSLQGLSQSFAEITKFAAGFTLGKAISEAPGQFLAMAHAAADDAASVARLHTAVDNAASGGWARYGKAIDKAIESGQKLAFTDDDTRSALSLLEAQTGNTEDALRRLSVAEDFARGANIDLGAAAKLLGKVTDESAAALSRYGIHVAAGATAQEALNAVDAKFKGQAGAFAESDAGKFAIAADKIDEMKEALGARLLPALSTAADGVGLFADAITRLSSTGVGSEVFKAMAAAVGGVLVVALGAATVAAIGAAVAFTGLDAAALPWIALAAGIGIAVYEIVTHFDDLTSRIPYAGQAIDVLREAFAGFFAEIKGVAAGSVQLIKNVVDIYASEFGLLVAIVENVGHVFRDFFTFHWGDLGDDVSAAVDAIGAAAGNMATQVIGVFDGVGTAFTEASDMTVKQSTKVGDAFIAMKEDMLGAGGATDLLAGSTAAMGDQFGAMTQWIDNAAHSMDGYRTGAESAWSAQSALNDMLSDASGKVSFWEGNLKTAEGALKILNDQVASGTPLTAKQTTEQDILTTAVGRYQGGVEDAQGAVVDAAAAQAEFILIQDDLNGKLAAGTITQGEYNAQMADATSKIDPATSAAYGLATAQDTVAVAIDGVVNKLGNMLIDLGLLPESKRTEFQTPGLDEAISGTQLLGEGIGALPTEFTIYASLDYTAFDAGINHIAGYTPQSPAKEGPLSKVPDWSFLTWTLKPTMDAAVQTMADGATGMVGAVSSTVAKNVPDWAIMFAALPGVTTDAEEIFGWYIEQVKADGNILNDWLLRLPEQLRPAAEAIGRKVWTDLATSTTILPPLMYDTGVKMMSSFYDGATAGLDTILGPSGSLVNVYEDVLGPGSPMYKAASEAGYGAGVSFVNGFATGVVGLSADVLKNLKIMIPKLGAGATQLVGTIVDVVAKGGISMKDAAALFTQPMIDQLKTMEDNLKVQLAQAWLDGTDPGPIQAQLDVVHELYAQATLDLLQTADAAHLAGSAYLDMGNTAIDAAGNVYTLATEATGAAGSIGEVGAAAAATNAYLIDMGGYLSEAAMQMGNVASGATSLYDALNGGLVGGPYQGGGPLGTGGSQTSGSFLLGGEYTAFPTGGKSQPTITPPPATQAASGSDLVVMMDGQLVGQLVSATQAGLAQSYAGLRAS